MLAGKGAVPLSFNSAGSSKDNGKTHEFGWRDFMDICVKWRQISEPNDPVFWIDLLAPEAFAEVCLCTVCVYACVSVCVCRPRPLPGSTVRLLSGQLFRTQSSWHRVVGRTVVLETVSNHSLAPPSASDSHRSVGLAEPNRHCEKQAPQHPSQADWCQSQAEGGVSKPAHSVSSLGCGLPG